MVMTHESFEWTQRRLDLLRQLVKAGEPFPLIAAKLGTTKGSALGKAQRHGLTGCTAKTLAGGKSRHGNQIRRAQGHVGANNPGGIRQAALSREADKNRPARRGSAEFMFGNKKARVADAKPSPLPLFDGFKDAANVNTARAVSVSESMRPVVDSGLVRTGAAEFRALERGQCQWIDETPRRYFADLAVACGERCAGHTPYCSRHLARATGAGTPSERRAMQGIAAE